MSLLDLPHAHTVGMNIQTIVNNATNSGKLLDGSDGSKEFREFLSKVDDISKLAEYANSCIENSFADSGKVLQDIVNEIGNRLEFRVENGLYQGVRGAIGYDGIWKAKSGSLVVEVKTTDAYAVKLDAIISYRDRLVDAGRVPKDTPVLFVIGRADTGSLETQIKGSRYAEDVRIISVDALIKLMEVKLSTSSSDVLDKIHTILRPMEYTRIDSIVDLVFTATEDNKETEYSENFSLLSDNFDIDNDQDPSVDPNQKTTAIQRIPPGIIDKKKAYLINLFEDFKNISLQKKRSSHYANPDDSIRVVVLVSKRYEKAYKDYWYNYHDKSQRQFLRGAEQGYLILGMHDKEFAFALPFDFLESIWDCLRETKLRGMYYKHFDVIEQKETFILKTSDVFDDLEINQYIFPNSGDS